ncbi:MAG: RecQ family ATP-dependent DNA helicase [Blastocatellia bacterium]
MDKLESALSKHFGFEQFRPNQREVIEHALARRSALAVLPTGLGKSLCYQLPAQIMSGLTLVISPLIALMQDQVDAMERRGFKNVTYLNSALSPSEVGRRFSDIERGLYKLVYVAPERCDSPRFQQLVRQTEISLVVIDEAHCISQWGHDFRPHYRTMLTRLPELKRATFLALTATATPEVQRDIVAALALPDIQRVIADFNRPNLHFETFHIDDRESKDKRLLDLLSRDDGAAIVYASTRKEASTVHQLLESRGFNAALYHAGLDAAKRSEAQRRFLQGDCRVITATVAFGLGIDKPDVRRVIHYNIPGSLENYYQEAGRAGRDGAMAVCTLFYSQSDVRIQRFLLEQSYPDPRTMLQIYGLLRDAHPLAVGAGDLATASGKQEIAVNASLQLLYEQQWARITADGKYLIEKPEITQPKIEAHSMRERRRRAEGRLRKAIAYALEAQCRRAQILGYFGQKFPAPCGACDVCAPAATAQTAVSQIAAPTATPAELLASEASDRVARIILQTVAEFGGRLGRTIIADALAGSKRKRIIELNLDRSDHYGALRLHTQERTLKWIDEMIAQRLLKTTAEEYPCLMITERGVEALNGKSLLALSGLAQASMRPAPDKTAVERFDNAVSEELAQALKQWRREKAASLNVPPYVILHDSAVEEIAGLRPQSPDQLRAIKGIGDGKLAQFGAEIISVVQNFAGEVGPEPSPADPRPSLDPPSDWRLQVEIWRQGGAKPDRKMLLNLLRDMREGERDDLITLIGALKDLNVREAGENLLILLGETTHGNLINAICDALGQLGVEDAAGALVRLLDDERQGARRIAARALGRLRARPALGKLEQLAAADAVESVRIAAAAAAWRIKTGSSS